MHEQCVFRKVERLFGERVDGFGGHGRSYRRKKTTGLRMLIAVYSQGNVNARLPKVFPEV